MSKRNSFSAPKIWFVVTTTVSVFPTPVGPSKRKLPRGLAGLVRPSSPRRTAEMMRGNAWDCPRISRASSKSSPWSLMSFTESIVAFMTFSLAGTSLHVVYHLHLRFGVLWESHRVFGGMSAEKKSKQTDQRYEVHQKYRRENPLAVALACCRCGHFYIQHSSCSGSEHDVQFHRPENRHQQQPCRHHDVRVCAGHRCGHLRRFRHTARRC